MWDQNSCNYPVFRTPSTLELKYGVSGSFSEVYQAYEALQQQANLEELTLKTKLSTTKSSPASTIR